MTAFNSSFQAAIPGSSIAHKWGSFPFSQPPQFTKPNDALEYIWKNFHKKDSLKQLWYLQEKGAKTSQIARALLHRMAVEGLIQFNLAVMLYPTVGQMIETLGKAKGIDVKTYPKMKDKLSSTLDNDSLNHLDGHKHGNFAYPRSALASMPRPSDEDMKKQHSSRQKLAASLIAAQAGNPEIQPEPQGLLSKAASNNEVV